MPSTPLLWGSTTSKLLQTGIDFNGGPQLLTGSAVPTTTATLGTIGSLYLCSTNGILYAKNDAGTTTNWSPSGGRLPAGQFSPIGAQAFVSGTETILQFGTTVYDNQTGLSLNTINTQNVTYSTGVTTATATNGALLFPGMLITSTGVSGTVYIQSISGNTITMSAIAVANGSASSAFKVYQYTAKVPGIYGVDLNLLSLNLTGIASEPIVFLYKNNVAGQRFDTNTPALASQDLVHRGSFKISAALNDVFHLTFIPPYAVTLQTSGSFCSSSFTWCAPV